MPKPVAKYLLGSREAVTGKGAKRAASEPVPYAGPPLSVRAGPGYVTHLPL